MIKFLKSIIYKLSGRPAELIYTFNEKSYTTTFENNYKMKRFISYYNGVISGIEVVYKRKEWFKWFVRIFWIIEISAIIGALIFEQSTVLMRTFEVMLLLVYIASCKTNVITMDW
ncbi:hypothetical protein KIJ05_07770 [Leuconostoc gelidum subsp. gasicomitatum]|uniref:hypothetical protein n=1 Tax=Leuconostoc gasicomitatum TaxID=115778 RepID=UPI001CC38E29|nr:hypothetical protein [Leuconostoc gasicomitatum]MBZ5985014.1 hypothetical protein [Leuconostoc gasicomitatum]